MVLADSFQLLFGDCLDLLPSLQDQSVDLILSDPPYGTTRCSWDSQIDLQALWQEFRRVSKPTTAIVLTAAQPFSSALVMSNPFMFRYEWIWEKGNATGFLNAKKQPLRAHESILVFYNKQPTYNPQMTDGHERKVAKRGKVGSDCYGVGNQVVAYDSTQRYPRSVQFFSSDKQKEALHPTQKPLALMEYLIRTYSDEGDTVLDSCMGSGTTGVACVNTGRRFVGMEKDEGYFKMAFERIWQHGTN